LRFVDLSISIAPMEVPNTPFGIRPHNILLQILAKRGGDIDGALEHK
jgi:hypothetical protein